MPGSGRGGTLLRSVAWFGGDGGVPAALVPIAYAAAGLLLTATTPARPDSPPRSCH